MFDFKTAEVPLGRIADACSLADGRGDTVVLDRDLPQSEAREAIGLSLEHAFPIGDGGAFTGLLRAIDEAC